MSSLFCAFVCLASHYTSDHFVFLEQLNIISGGIFSGYDLSVSPVKEQQSLVSHSTGLPFFTPSGC